jgi:hypothetical protein
VQGGLTDDDPASRDALMGDSVIFDETADGRSARAEYPGRLVEREGAIEGCLERIHSLAGRCFLATLFV